MVVCLLQSQFAADDEINYLTSHSTYGYGEGDMLTAPRPAGVTLGNSKNPRQCISPKFTVGMSVYVRMLSFLIRKHLKSTIVSSFRVSR